MFLRSPFKGLRFLKKRFILEKSMDLKKFWGKVEEAKRIGIAGHIRPDGDCIGSCLGMANYIRENFKASVDVYAEEFNQSFCFLKGSNDIIFGYPDIKEPYDVFIVLDSGDLERIGAASKYYETAIFTACFDHHRTNMGLGDECLIDADASACAELIFSCMDYDRISRETAEALYLGIVHDTGVFKHSNTTGKTMEIAGRLLDKGVSAQYVMDKTFFEKTYIQNQILGRCLMESILLMDGKVIFSTVTKEVQELYGLKNSDMDGIIDNLRNTQGVEVAILLKEEKNREWKVSLRSKDIIDVSTICKMYSGGGHIRAAGCSMHGSVYDVINSLTREIEKHFLN